MPATKRAMDFENVKDGGQFNPRRVPAGDYVMKIVSVDDHTSGQGNEGWVFTCVIADNPGRATYPYYCGADTKQAWKIRKLFIACGRDVPKKKVMVDPNKLMNHTFGASLDDDEYEGRLKSVIVDTFPEDEVDDQPEEDDAPPPPKKTTKKATRRAPEPEDDDEDDEVEDEPAPRRRAAKKATAKKTTRKAPEPDDDEDEDIDDLELDEL